MEPIIAQKRESVVNTHQLARDVMIVLDTARKQLGLVYPKDKTAAAD
ncbi:hypothetical protein [Pseudoalteromonas sp. S1731]|nr:hypothetical protein [Pseudoalteromonas sp. S1731]